MGGWIPLVTAAVLSILGMGLYSIQRHRQEAGAKAYRQRFVQLVRQLDTVTSVVNDLAEGLKFVNDSRVLDYYEGTLRLLETLLGAVKKVEPYGTNLAALNSAAYLIRDLRERVGRLQSVFQRVINREPLDINELKGVDGDMSLPQVKGCYFCSRPVIVERIAAVKVRIDGQIREVVGCKICRDELSTTKKVKVLHFMQEGKPLHWSLVNDYQPSEDFWNINKREPVQPKRRLELVPSHTEVSQSE